MRHLDLCSGIGGFALGFEWAKLSKPVLFCDIEPWSRQILIKHWPDVPIADDVKELARDPNRLVPDHDIITAGYPCQPFSMAGQRRGEEDDRHIWPEIFAIVQAKRPHWCVFENVFGHVSMGLDQVLSDMEGENYTCQAFIIPACALDAPHRRDRVWIVANTNSIPDAINRRHRPIEKESSVRGNNQRGSRSDVGGITGAGKNEADGKTPSHSNSNSQSDGTIHEQRMEYVANTDSLRPQRVRSKRHAMGPIGLCGGETGWQSDFWFPEPPVGRVAHGIPRRVDRLRGLGNAIVPQVAMQIGLTIKEIENGSKN